MDLTIQGNTNLLKWSLQLEDLQGVWLDTRVNGSRVKKYKKESASEDKLDQP